MINIINSPALNRVLLDGNNTVITITSSNGAGYYFRAKIYINDVLFDEQSWSRVDNFTANKDLLALYYAYFQHQFTSTFTNGLVEATHLTKKVDITIEERLLSDDSLVETIDLPTFYIMHNVKSRLFGDTDKVAILGLDASVMRVPVNGKIVIPFFVNATAENVVVTTTLNDDTVINTQTVTALTGKKAYVYTFNLDGSVDYVHLFVKTTITVGATTSERIYKIMRHPSFEVKEVVFRNNFGFYIPAYFDGEFSDESGFKVETYEANDGSERVFTIDETSTYKIYTGYLLHNENAIVSEISNSLECFFKNGTQYLPINTNTKKVLLLKDKQHQYPETLQFEIKKGLPLDNNAFFAIPTVDDIVISGDENDEFDIAKSVFEAVYEDEIALQGIVFPTLPAVGILRIETSEGLNLVVANQLYLWSDVVKFTYVSGFNDSGTPYTNFTFKLFNNYVYSNTANAVVNITDLPDINLPPTITINPAFIKMYVPAGGDADKLINTISIVDPDDDDFTILFEILGAPAGVSIINETTINPIITALSTSPDFYMKVTATDINDNVSDLTFLVDVIVVTLQIDGDIVGTVDDETTYDIIVTGGIEGETVDLIFDYNVYSNLQYARIFSDDIEAEQILTLSNRLQTVVVPFDASGEVAFQVVINDAEMPHANLTITIDATSGASTIPDKDNFIIL